MLFLLRFAKGVAASQLLALPFVNSRVPRFDPMATSIGSGAQGGAGVEAESESSDEEVEDTESDEEAAAAAGAAGVCAGVWGVRSS